MGIPKFQDLFVPIRTNWNRLYLYNALFDLWKHFYLMNVWMVPFLVLGSGLFVGLLTFGVMMQVNDAFTRVNNTVSQFIQNWQIITEVRSIYRRLGEFEQHLPAPQPHQEAEQQSEATGLRGKILSHSYRSTSRSSGRDRQHVP